MRRHAVLMAIGVALLAGCGDSGEESGESAAGGSQGKTVVVRNIVDQTGIAAFSGEPGDRGVQLAVDQANSSGELGDVKIKLDTVDSASDPKEATTLMTQAARDEDVSAALFGVLSASALAAAPVAQREKLPLVLHQSAAPGTVEAGNYVFRATAPQPVVHPVQSAYFAKEGIKRVAVVYASDSAILAQLAEDVYPKLAADDGYEIVTTVKTTATQTDFATAVGEVVDARPDAVVVLLVGKPTITFLTQLQRAGYDGLVGLQTGTTGGVLKPLGAAAKGFVYPLDFHPSMSAPSSKKFTEPFKQRYGEEPNAFNAGGYDAARLLIEALKTTDDYSRDGIRQALENVTQKGISGAVGELRFENRDARVPGVLVEWDGKAEKLVVDASGEQSGG